MGKVLESLFLITVEAKSVILTRYVLLYTRTMTINRRDIEPSAFVKVVNVNRP